MSIRHIVAFTLIGWYLMAPPQYVFPSGHGTTKVEKDAPMDKWDTYQVFDTADACKLQLEAWQEGAIKRLKHHRDFDQTLIDNQSFFAQCIASDDPRLAK
jgi:hypothetical protein